jgi:hypothetical protein
VTIRQNANRRDAIASAETVFNEIGKQVPDGARRRSNPGDDLVGPPGSRTSIPRSRLDVSAHSRFSPVFRFLESSKVGIAGLTGK